MKGIAIVALGLCLLTACGDLKSDSAATEQSPQDSNSNNSTQAAPKDNNVVEPEDALEVEGLDPLPEANAGTSISPVPNSNQDPSSEQLDADPNHFQDSSEVASPTVTLGLVSTDETSPLSIAEADLSQFVRHLNQSAFAQGGSIYHHQRHIAFSASAIFDNDLTSVAPALAIENSSFEQHPTTYFETFSYLNRLLDREPELVSNTALWAQSDFAFAPEFSNRMVARFDAELNNIDFNKNNNDFRTEFEAWLASSQSSLKRNHLQNANTDTRLVAASILSSSYGWQTQFSALDTQEQEFYLSAHREPITHPMMHLTLDAELYQDETVTLIQLPTSSENWRIYFAKSTYLEQAEDLALNLEQLTRLSSQTTLTSINLVLPRLNLSEYDNLRSEFPSSITSPATASLPALTLEAADSLYLPSAYLKKEMQIDETGVHFTSIATSRIDKKPDQQSNHGDASVATYLINLLLTTNELPIDVHFNSPFQYFVLHVPTGTMLYLGHIKDPRGN